jgi:hypothetical protein
MIKDFIKENNVSCIGTINNECGDDSIINELEEIQSDNYYFVTNDIDLQKRVKKLNFTVYNKKEFLNIIRSKPLIKQSIYLFYKNYYKSFLQGFFIAAMFMVILVLSVSLLFIYPSVVIIIKKIPLSMVILVFGGSYLLYLFRMKRRIFYGASEIVIGIITIFFVINSSSENNSISDILKICGGFYIIIRGLENVEKSIVSPDIKQMWERIFFNKKK